MYALVSLSVWPSVSADGKGPVTCASVMSVTTFSPMEAHAPMNMTYFVGVCMEIHLIIA